MTGPLSGSAEQESPETETAITDDYSGLIRDDGADMAIRGLAAQRRRPQYGWHNMAGFTARQVRRFARTEKMQRFSLSALSFDAITPHMLHAVYRQKLMGELEQAADLASLNTIGRLLEKIPPLELAADSTVAADSRQLEDSLRRTELLLERLRDSHALLDCTAADQPETHTPQPDVVQVVDHASACRECQ